VSLTLPLPASPLIRRDARDLFPEAAESGVNPK